MATNNKPRIRKSKQISAAKLAEFEISGSGRRMTIVRDLRVVKTFIVNAHTETRNAIVEQIVRGLGDDFVQSTANALALNPDKTKGSNQREAFLLFNGMDLPDLAGAIVTAVPINKDADLTMGDVTVSVRLDVMIRIPNPKGKDRIGAIMLVFNKTRAKSKRTQISEREFDLMIALMRKQLENVEGKVDPSLLFVFDIFTQRVHCSAQPKVYKRLLNVLEAACTLVSVLWDRDANPPPASSGPDQLAAL
jgi:hypothetical protein